jgi:hypothetical protein
VAAVVLGALAVGAVVVVARSFDDPTMPAEAVATKDPVTTSTTSTTTTTTIITTTEPPTTTTEPPTTTTAAPTTTTAKPKAKPQPVGRDLSPYTGLGTWIDIYDWTVTYNRGDGRVELADIDAMARSGVQTLYMQTAKWDNPAHVLEPERLRPLMKRAKQLGIEVVAWYLPTFEDPVVDLHRLLEAARIPEVDAVAVDIESLRFPDVAVRNQRLLDLSRDLRAALPDVALGAIPYPPVVTDVINPNLWPAFPWQELTPFYDVWLPMSYQSNRKPESGYRDAYRYTAENIDRMRARLGANVPVHAIGGIADATSVADVHAMLQAGVERGIIGGSLYDWRTSGPELWPALAGFRDPAR